MIGDAGDMRSRLRAALPSRWFADVAPVLDGVLAGFADAWSRIFELLDYVRAQGRLASAVGDFLDLFARDFFPDGLRRRDGEGDDSYRARIRRSLLRQRATRPGLVAVVEELTGGTPDVFEPWRPADIGAWNVLGGYGVAGRWGSLALPLQCFVTIRRPPRHGIAMVAGYGTGGPLEYGSLAMTGGVVADAEIMRVVAETMPASSIAWVRLEN